MTARLLFFGTLAIAAALAFSLTVRAVWWVRDRPPGYDHVMSQARVVGYLNHAGTAQQRQVEVIDPQNIVVTWCGTPEASPLPSHAGLTFQRCRSEAFSAPRDAVPSTRWGGFGSTN